MASLGRRTSSVRAFALPPSKWANTLAVASTATVLKLNYFWHATCSLDVGILICVLCASKDKGVTMHKLTLAFFLAGLVTVAMPFAALAADESSASLAPADRQNSLAWIEFNSFLLHPATITTAKRPAEDVGALAKLTAARDADHIHVYRQSIGRVMSQSAKGSEKKRAIPSFLLTRSHPNVLGRTASLGNSVEEET